MEDDYDIYILFRGRTLSTLSTEESPRHEHPTELGDILRIIIIGEVQPKSIIGTALILSVTKKAVICIRIYILITLNQESGHHGGKTSPLALFEDDKQIHTIQQILPMNPVNDQEMTPEFY